MKREFRGFGKVFSFTFRHHIKSSGYRNTTIAIALICFLIPLAVINFGNFFDRSEPVPEPEFEQQGMNYTEYHEEDESEVVVAPNMEVSRIYLVDKSEDGLTQMKGLADLIGLQTGKEAIELIDCGADFDKARDASYGNDDELIITVDQVGRDYEVAILIPEDSSITEENLEWLQPVVQSYTDLVKQSLNGPTGSQGDVNSSIDQDDEHDFNSKKVVAMAITFLNIMFMYFFVLLYGQNVATSVIMEKSSRLIEIFLVTVKPSAMIMGKLLAITLGGFVQMTCWIVSVFAGVLLGSGINRLFNPNASNALYQLFDIVKAMTGDMFSIGGVIIALLMATAGILLYCSIAGIGGAMASKQEDLASTNILFTMILIASYFATLFGGGIEGFSGDIAWLKACLDWIPFTSVLVVPAKLLTGSVSIAYGLASLAIVVAAILIFTVLSGKIYKALILHKGRMLSAKEILRIASHK